MLCAVSCMYFLSTQIFPSPPFPPSVQASPSFSFPEIRNSCPALDPVNLTDRPKPHELDYVNSHDNFLPPLPGTPTASSPLRPESPKILPFQLRLLIYQKSSCVDLTRFLRPSFPNTTMDLKASNPSISSLPACLPKDPRLRSPDVTNSTSLVQL